MEAQITDCKDTFNVEVSLLNTQLEEEWETGRRDKEERRKITKKVGGSGDEVRLSFAWLCPNVPIRAPV